VDLVDTCDPLGREKLLEDVHHPWFRVEKLVGHSISIKRAKGRNRWLEKFRTTVEDAYGVRLKAAIRGSRVKPNCDPRAKPTVFGVPAPTP
jgi:hypothetical protein